MWFFPGVLKLALEVSTAQVVTRPAASSVRDQTTRVITWTGLVIWAVYKMTSRPLSATVRCSIIVNYLKKEVNKQRKLAR